MDTTGIKAAFDAGAAAADAESRIVDISMHEDGISVPVAIVPADMRVAVIHEALEAIERRQLAPSRCKGIATLTELDSFIAHVNRFRTDESVVFADKNQLTAVYDYHAHGAPQWCAHRAVYTCPLSKAWLRWTNVVASPLRQEALADFLDEHLDDLTSPEAPGDATPVLMLEVARNLAIHTRGTFQRKINPTTGEHTMVCKEEHGESSTKIPPRFFLALPVYEGGVLYRVEVRIHFRLKEGVPLFTLIMHRSEEIVLDAFKAIRAAVIEQTGLAIFAGSPEK
jgi:uncharacterized protein YfdQ (DUF2303 family)